MADTDPRYATHFRAHLADVQRHLSGSSKGLPLPPSFIPPTGYWLPAEKDAFFHALSVHSRLRPDLIAADLPNKSTADVCAYLDLLARAAAPHHDATLRSALGAALEVSDEWIAHEEELARVLAAVEPEWERDVVRKRRDAELRDAMKDVPRHGKPRRAEMKQLREARRLQWELEDELQSLDGVHLGVMDRLLRDDQDPTTGDIKDESEPPQDAADEEMIDLSTRDPINSNAQSTPPPSPRPSTSLPLVLSPASRRRLQKRLYMRRKRAAIIGATPSAENTRLKPGRKPKRKRVPDDASASEEEMEQGAQEDEDEKRHPHIGGTTRPYKINKFFAASGLNAERLRAEGLDLFHLAAGKCSTYAADAPASISFTVLRLLHAHVAAFLRQLVHRVLVVRELERAQKRHTKVWRLAEDHIVPANVEHALEMMMVDGWAARFGTGDDTEPEEDNAMEEDRDGRDEGDGEPEDNEADSEDADGEDTADGEGEGEDVAEEHSARGSEDPSPPPPPVHPPSLHQQIYAPLVRLPSDLEDVPDPDPNLNLITNPNLDPDEEADEDDDDIDDVREERELDAKDQVAGRVAEGRLRSHFGGGERGVKSQAYIEDSGSD